MIFGFPFSVSVDSVDTFWRWHGSLAGLLLTIGVSDPTPDTLSMGAHGDMSGLG
jgi:hypothetical protein